MKALSLFLACTCTLVLLIGNNNVRAEQSVLAVYTNDRFEIKHPSDWSVTDSGTVGMVFRSPDGLGNVWVQIKNTTSPSVPHILDFELIESSKNNHYTLSNHPAQRLVGIASFQGHHVKMMTYTFKTSTKIYTVAYMSPIKTWYTYLPVAQNMIDSFRIINELK